MIVFKDEPLVPELKRFLNEQLILHVSDDGLIVTETMNIKNGTVLMYVQDFENLLEKVFELGMSHEATTSFKNGNRMHL